MTSASSRTRSPSTRPPERSRVAATRSTSHCSRVRCTSPAPDVISVSVGPFPRRTTAVAAVRPHRRSIGAGQHHRRRPARPRSPRVPSRPGSARESWNLEFLADGRVLTASGFKAMALLTTASGETYLREQLSLGVGEVVYGLGERFGPLVKNGQVVDIWNADGGTSSEQAYKNVPFYLTNARLRGVRQPSRCGLVRGRRPRRCRGSSSAWPASHWSTWSSTAPRRRRSCASTRR